MRYALWGTTAPVLRPAPLAEARRRGAQARRLGEWVRMEKTIATVLNEAHKPQVEEAADALEEGPKSFYKGYLDQ